MIQKGFARRAWAGACVAVSIAILGVILTAGGEPDRTASALSAVEQGEQDEVATPSGAPAAAKVAAEVRARYAAYREAQPAIETSRAADRPDLLRPFLAEPARSRVLAGLEALDAAGRRPYGRPVSRVFSVEVDRGRAVLHDCRDERLAGQLDVATGRRLTVGVANTHVVARFARVDGRWLIARFELSEQPCS